MSNSQGRRRLQTVQMATTGLGKTFLPKRQADMCGQNRHRLTAFLSPPLQALQNGGVRWIGVGEVADHSFVAGR